jgi:hypothetical protein
MKKTLLIVFIISLFCGCPWPFLPENCQNTIEDCAQWCVENIKYEDDKTQFRKDDYWQTINEIRKNMKGDCEDVCAIFMEMCHKRGNKNIYMYVTKLSINSHAIVEVDGIIYNLKNDEIPPNFTTFNGIKKWPFKWIYKISYEEYKELAEINHEFTPIKNGKEYGIFNEDI